VHVGAATPIDLRHFSHRKLRIIILYYENDSAHTDALDIMMPFVLFALFPK
jgi:hypothetical protein